MNNFRRNRPDERRKIKKRELIFIFILVFFAILFLKDIYDQRQELKKIQVKTIGIHKQEITLNIDNTLSRNIRNVVLNCETVVSSDKFLMTKATILDTIIAKSSKNVVVTRLDTESDAVDIAYVKTLTCNVSGTD